MLGVLIALTFISLYLLIGLSLALSSNHLRNPDESRFWFYGMYMTYSPVWFARMHNFLYVLPPIQIDRDSRNENVFEIRRVLGEIKSLESTGRWVDQRILWDLCDERDRLREIPAVVVSPQLGNLANRGSLIS